MPQWVDAAGFRALLALLGTNAAGIGTSSINAYEARVSALPLPPAEKEDVEGVLNGLYETMDEGMAVLVWLCVVMGCSVGGVCGL